MLCADPGARFSLHGTHGSYRKFGVDPQEPALVGGARPPILGDATPWLDEPASDWGTLTIATKRSEPVSFSSAPYPTERGDYRAFYANVRDAILGLCPLTIPAKDGYRVMRLLEFARDSSNRQTTIPIALD
jgi:predicted dehydrogenase